jgi:hypothetical protein
MLEPAEARKPLDSIHTATPIGLHDRALAPPARAI